MGKPKSNRRLSEKKKDKEKADRGAKAPRTGMARDVGAVVLLALAASSGLALATYSSLDAALIARGMPPANLVGPVGHRCASAIYAVLGFSALVVPIALGAAAWRLFRGAPPRITVVSALAYAALTLSVAALAHLALGGRAAAPFPAGGAVGATLAVRAERLFSTWGSAIVLSSAATVALIVAADVKPQTIAGGIAAVVRALFGFASSRVAAAVEEHRVAVAELRAEEAARRDAADALADSAEIEADGEADRAEARAVAGALALEEVRRNGFDDPAWVGALAPAAEEAEAAAPEEADPPKRKRKAKDEKKAEEPALEAIAAP